MFSGTSKREIFGEPLLFLRVLSIRPCFNNPLLSRIPEKQAQDKN